MAFPTLLASNLRFTQSPYYGRPVAGAVPDTRNINTTAPLTGGGNLTADLTLGITMTPLGSASVVGSARTIAGSGPVTINGGGIAFLTNDITVGVSQFDAANPGIVSASGGGVVNFLRADNTWQAVAGGTGVPATRLITTTAPLTIDGVGSADLSADRTLAVGVFSAGASGIVPASGGGTTNFLRADGSWVPSGVGQFVRLQTSGVSVDTGMSDVTVSDAASHVNFIPLAYGGLEAPIDYLHVVTVSGTGGSFSGAVLDGVGVAGITPSLTFRKANGSVGARTSVANGDNIGSIWAKATTNSGENTHKVLSIIADGTPAGGDFQYATHLTGSQIGAANTLDHWICGQGEWVGLNQATRPAANPARFYVNGTIGTKTRTTTGALDTGTLDDSTLFVDCTTGQKWDALPGVGNTGAMFAVTRIDKTGVNNCVISASVNGFTDASLQGGNDSVLLQSDGMQWRILAERRAIQQRMRFNVVGDTLSNFTGPLAFATQFARDPQFDYAQGGSFRLHWVGQVSCTGTPTLTLKVCWNTTGGHITNGPTFTMPNNTTSQYFHVDITAALDASGNVGYTSGLIHMPADNSNTLTALSPNPASTSFSGNHNFLLSAAWSAADPANTLDMLYAYMDFYPPGYYAA